MRIGIYRGAMALAILLVAAVVVFPQGVGSTRGLPDASGGTHTIQGHVYLPSGRSADQGIVVKLESGVVGQRSTATDGTGTFNFHGLPAAEYTVIVDAGPDWEPLRESVVIYGTGGLGGTAIGTGTMLNLHLVPKGATAAAETAFEGVSKDAVQDYKKAMQSGDDKKAIDLLNSAVTKHAKFSLALGELGTRYLKLGQPQKASEFLKRAVELQPKDFMLHLNYGIALLNVKDLPAAEKELREALKLNVTSPTAHMYLGITLLTLSKDEKTKEFFPDKYAEAQKELEAATSTGKVEVAMAHKYLGGVYWGNKEYQRAAAEFEAYLKLQPKAPDADRLKAAIQELKNKN
ncbi:MAG: tetratricopeptide repeat protein [Pyrinomonadaceae bacterium]